MNTKENIDYYLGFQVDALEMEGLVKENIIWSGCKKKEFMRVFEDRKKRNPNIQKYILDYVSRPTFEIETETTWEHTFGIDGVNFKMVKQKEKPKMTTQEKIDYIVRWIREYADNAGMESLVVGVSGGVDSALVSTLCAMTGMKTYCVYLPIGLNREARDLAVSHIEWLESKYVNVSGEGFDLTEIFRVFKSETFATTFNSELGFANSKARLRMTALYQIASSTKGLVVGTGNAVELATGFGSKFGDFGIDIEPIGDLTKTQVYELSRELGINQAIIDVPPTDGLFDDGRTDEDSFGCTYEELEWVIEEYNSKQAIMDVYIPRKKEVRKIYLDLHKKSEHKRNLPPVCKIPE